MAESLHTVSSLPYTYVSDADRFRSGESAVGKTVETAG